MGVNIGRVPYLHKSGLGGNDPLLLLCPGYFFCHWNFCSVVLKDDRSHMEGVMIWSP